MKYISLCFQFKMEDQFQIKEENFDPEDSKPIFSHESEPPDSNFMIKQEPSELNYDMEEKVDNKSDYIIPGSPEFEQTNYLDEDQIVFADPILFRKQKQMPVKDDGKERKFNCKICNASFTTKYQVPQHIKVEFLKKMSCGESKIICRSFLSKGKNFVLKLSKLLHNS